MRSNILLLALALMSVARSGAAGAGPLDEARDAHLRGDYTAEFRLLRPLAEQGNAEAQEAFGTLYVMGESVPQDYSEAVKWFRLAAEQGFAEAMDDLARMYVHGEGVPKNYVQAHMWFNLVDRR
jgi:TPR repeat protein